nr:hypothetical protein [uncultured Treponema sp.]
MKKILTIFLFATISKTAFSAPVEFSSSLAFSIPVDEDKRMVRDISSIKHDYGLKLNLGNTTMVGNGRLSSVKVMDLYGISPEDFFHLQEYTCGFKYSKKTETLKVDLMIGNLKYSGGISRLKNPSFTCPSPFYKKSVPVAGITPALPSSSSSETEYSWATDISTSEKSFFPSVQFAILESGEKYGSIYKNFSSRLVPGILVSFTGGTFFHEYWKDTGWFQNERYYLRSDYFSGEFSTSLLWKNLKTTFSIGLYENPFGGTRQWARTQSNLNLGAFSLGLFFFESDEDIITSTGKSPRIGQQIFISPKINFKTGKGISFLGATLGQTTRKSKKRMSIPFTQYEAKVGVSYTTMAFSLKGNYDYDFSTESLKEKETYGISAGISMGSLNSTTAYSVSFSDEKNKTYRITEKFSFSNKTLENINASFYWTEGKNNDGWNFDINTAFSKNTKKMKMKGKFAFNFRKVS